MLVRDMYRNPHTNASLESVPGDFRQYMEVANDEDKILAGALHQRSASPRLPAGTCHPLERNLWQFTSYLARACDHVAG